MSIKQRDDGLYIVRREFYGIAKSIIDSDGEKRPVKAIEMAEAYAHRENISVKEIRDAADYAAAYAAYAATASKNTLKACADIVRKHYPNPNSPRL